MRSMLRTVSATLVTAALFLPGLAFAGEDEPPHAPSAAAGQAPSTAPAGGWLAGRLVDEDELSRQRGGADLHVNENNASAIVRDNVATNLTTGNNSINGDSFSGMSGVPMVVQNSGNNVVIQNSTILNLQLQ